jgi:hypothetical protein
MLRTEFEDAVINDAFKWYATTDEFKLNFNDVSLEEFQAAMLSNSRSMKTFIENYWSNLLGNYSS